MLSNNKKSQAIEKKVKQHNKRNCVTIKRIDNKRNQIAITYELTNNERNQLATRRANQQPNNNTKGMNSDARRTNKNARKAIRQVK
jgi:hypothetical protein